ncbi:hypothetical protein Enr13x_21530 [Stieleria neptunia]|uniref:Methanolan biosynthesis EpsI domain-containing protein n=2 Tax=Stieleria neptunia TaxID=2527979 RepID=A0A518HN75_9BACT|nr:hypothetical protein Enr13x_21530 [Stieleria neptunia]
MIHKSVFAVFLLIAGNFAVSYIRDGYEKGSVVPPDRSLDETALQLGQWTGEDLPADPRIREILRAKAGVDRVYRDEAGREVLVHAVWTDEYLRLHFPQQCYREAGWEQIDEEIVEVTRRDGESFQGKLLHFVQAGRRIQVLYWFQLGEHVFLDRIEHRLLRRKVCWGQKEWPPLLKFMLETRDTGLHQSEELLTQFAGELSNEVSPSESGNS